MTQTEAFQIGQTAFKNKVLAELEKRIEILKELTINATMENEHIRAKMYFDCRVEIHETIKTINLIEL